MQSRTEVHESKYNKNSTALNYLKLKDAESLLSEERFWFIVVYDNLM